jgi:hypothetical protein
LTTKKLSYQIDFLMISDIAISSANHIYQKPVVNFGKTLRGGCGQIAEKPLGEKREGRRNFGAMKTELPRILFWDTDYSKIDWDAKARYVIERVVTYGTVADWRTLQQMYGMKRIREEVLQSREIDPKTLSFLSVIFDLPKERFRCYTLAQSSPVHWNY